MVYILSPQFRIPCCDRKYTTVERQAENLIAGYSMGGNSCDKFEKILRMVFNYMASATAIWLWRTSYALGYSLN